MVAAAEACHSKRWREGGGNTCHVHQQGLPGRKSTSRMAGVVVGGVLCALVLCRRASSWAAEAAILQQDSQVWLAICNWGSDTRSGSDLNRVLAHAWMLLWAALRRHQHLASAAVRHLPFPGSSLHPSSIPRTPSAVLRHLLPSFVRISFTPHPSPPATCRGSATSN